MKNSLIIVGAVAIFAAGYVYFQGMPGDQSAKISPTPTLAATVKATPKTTPQATPKATTIYMGTPGPTNTTLPASPTPGIIVQEHQVFQVSIKDFKFSPSPLTVRQGDVVVFTNLDNSTHTVTAFNLQFDSKNIRNNEHWNLVTANLAPGTYEYRCTLHPSMRGTLIVTQ
jgi:plastocyanin